MDPLPFPLDCPRDYLIELLPVFLERGLPLECVALTAWAMWQKEQEEL